MVTPNWNAFAGVTLIVLVVLIALARASQAMFVGEDEDGWEEPEATVETPDRRVRNGGDEWGGYERSRNGDERDDDERDTNESNDSSFEDQGRRPTEVSSPIPDEPFPAVESPTPVEDFTPGTLLVNVALSQGLFGVILVVAAVLTAIPADALGVGSATATQFGVGALLGVALYVANELGQQVVDAAGIEYEDSLREMLTPDSVRGWIVLLVLVLPIMRGSRNSCSGRPSWACSPPGTASRRGSSSSPRQPRSLSAMARRVRPVCSSRGRWVRRSPARSS